VATFSSLASNDDSETESKFEIKSDSDLSVWLQAWDENFTSFMLGRLPIRCFGSWVWTFALEKV
jgi:hypothetical protein